MQDNSDHSTEFTVSYEGDALSDHRMDAQDLGAALVALGKLFDRANLLLNGEGSSVKLDVRATQSGSFEIVLDTAQNFYVAPPFLAAGVFTSISNIRDIVVGTDSLITLIKRLKGNSPELVSEESSSDRVTLEIEGLRTEDMSVDSVRFDAPVEALRLLQDKGITDTFYEVVKPASKEGINRVSFRQGKQEMESVSKDEVPYFRLPDGTKIEEFVIPRQALVVVAPYLGSGQNKWRLRYHNSDNSSANYYAMKDEQFRDDVAKGVRKFGAGDILVCEVKVKSTLNDSQEYEILKVMAHHTKTEAEQSRF